MSARIILLTAAGLDAIADKHSGPFACQQQRGRLTDSRGAAGDDDGAVLGAIAIGLSGTCPNPMFGAAPGQC
jgi:hypothetical protein